MDGWRLRIPASEHSQGARDEAGDQPAQYQSRVGDESPDGGVDLSLHGHAPQAAEAPEIGPLHEEGLPEDGRLPRALSDPGMGMDQGMGGLGVVLVDALARIVSMNEAALRLLDGHAGVRVEPEGIRACSLRDNQQLRTLISDASQGPVQAERPRGALSVRGTDGRAALEVLVAPLLPEQRGESLGTATAVIYLIAPAMIFSTGRQPFARAHGLTRAEARVATLIAEGRTCRQAAEQLGVSHHTVRTQLKQIFLKTGARRQSGLVRLMMGAPSAVS